LWCDYAWIALEDLGDGRIWFVLWNQLEIQKAVEIKEEEVKNTR
jgi:hypothetical protein